MEKKGLARGQSLERPWKSDPQIGEWEVKGQSRVVPPLWFLDSRGRRGAGGEIGDRNNRVGKRVIALVYASSSLSR